jgi:hypothetical protein
MRVHVRRGHDDGGRLAGTAAGRRRRRKLAEALRLSRTRAPRALEVLDQLAVEQPRRRCLVRRCVSRALGGTEAAERAMADIVAADPFFALDSTWRRPRGGAVP